MPLLVLALVVLIGFGFVWLLVAVARAAPPYRADGATITLRHGQLLRGFALLAFFGAPLLFGLWLIFFPARSQTTLVPVVITVLALAVFALLLVWEAFQFQLTLSPAGLEGRSPWKGRFTHTWPQVTALSYSRTNAWFRLSFADGGAFHVSIIVPGVAKLLETCEHHLKPDQMANAKDGYRWVRRKWPYGEPSQ